MADTIGLLVVHGIGCQREGDLCREIASALAEGEPGQAHPGSRPSARERITLGLSQVVVVEANWADLSSLDNAPHVRLATPIVRDYLETVPEVWRRSWLRSMARWLDRWTFRHASTIFLTLAGLLLTTLVVWTFMESTEPPLVLSASLGLFYFFVLAYFAARNWRYRRLRLRRAPLWRRWLEPAVWAAVSIAAGSILLLFVVTLVFEFMLFFALPVAVAFVVGWVFWVVAAAVRLLVGTISSRRLAAVPRWIGRLTWVILVLPCHVFMQATRAAGNLISILFSERGWVPRLKAVGWLVVVYLAFLALLIVCELLLFPVLVAVVLLADGSTGAEMAGVILVTLAVVLLPYIAIIRLCLPGIDLLLDVANYHLAGADERRTYHEKVEAGIVQLRNEGCTEIHVLAHSLGTVLVYDWLHSTARGKHPIAVLYTVGSPLNKFWYVDHGVSRRRADREGMGAHVSRAWINFWARSDFVSGRLMHYNGAGLKVVNERVEKLGWFPLSHVGYWKDPTVIARLRKEIAGADRVAMT